MRMTVKTEQLLQDGGTPEYVYHDRKAWRCAVFVRKNITSEDIHKEMLHMYGGHYQLRQAVHNWVQKFSERRTSIEDEHRVDRITFQQQPQEFYAAGFQGLVKRWDKMVEFVWRLR